MNLRPIKDRILIKPEKNAETTESGLILAEHRKPEQTGTVIAVGPCAHPLRTEAEDMANWLKECADPDCNSGRCKASRLMLDLVRKEPAVKPGDYVVFSWTAGQEIWVEDGDERYLLMTENDILAVVEGLEA